MVALAGLTAWVKQIVLVALLAGVAELLLPQAGLRKYARTALGLLVLLAVLVPFLGFLRQGVDWQAAFADLPAAAPAPGPGPAQPDVRRLEAASLRLTVDLYRQRVARAAAETAARVEGVREAAAEVEVDGDPQSPRFGTITAAVVTVVPGERAEPGEVAMVRPVEIGGREPPPGGGEPASAGRLGDEAAGRLREAVAAAVARDFGLQPRQVRVVIRR